MPSVQTMKCQTCGNDTAPPSALEPVALTEAELAKMASRSFTELLDWAFELKGREGLWGDPTKAQHDMRMKLRAELISRCVSLPPAGRPVTPCTREEAVEIAKRAEVITPDIENAAVQGSKHFWVVRVIELMRLIDAARRVK